jgi:hypothetical protein
MSWAEFHQRSERLAAEAQSLIVVTPEKARLLYAEAAKAEAEALLELEVTKVRTVGVTAVSAVALWFKAREFPEAQRLAHRVLAGFELPPFAREQLQVLLQTIWSEEVRQQAPAKFTEGAVLVSVDGGEVLTGGAPLDLVVAKVELLQSIFFRTVEFLQGLPHRKRGKASFDVQMICRPWLFQAPPGSYQFAVAIEDVAQGNLFEQVATAEEIKGAFVALLHDATEDPQKALAERVPDKEYRGTFLKLTRALAPTGKDFSVMTIRRDALDRSPITLDANSRKAMAEVIRKDFAKPRAAGETEGTIVGTLRAVHLDDDWLEVTVDGQHKRVYGVGETVDDEIGPLMNRPVVVKILTQANGRITFVDIEADAVTV